MNANLTLPVAEEKTLRPRTNGRTLPVAFPSPALGPVTVPVQRCSGGRRVVEAALAILGQGEDLLLMLGTEDYARLVPLAFNGSIGGHYRHCLDHFTSVLRGAGSEMVDYDHRERNARIEREPPYALAVTRDLRARLAELPSGLLQTAVRTRCEVSYVHGSSPVTGSTLGRELVYAIAHAIHHYALISVMARLMGITLPEHFGVAPSTVAHLTRPGAVR